MGRDGARIVFDLLLEEVKSGLKLGVGSAEGGVRQIVDDDVRVNAVAFNKPCAVGAIDAEFGGGCEAVIGLRIIE